MKKILIIIIFFVALTIATGCSKDKQTLVNSAWTVESIKLHADSALIYPPDIWEWNNISIVLSFNNQNSYMLQKEANRTWGKVSIVGNKINFKKGFTTLVCCDSPFSDSCLLLLINNIRHYTVDDDNFILKGTKGELINLVKY